MKRGTAHRGGRKKYRQTRDQRRPRQQPVLSNRQAMWTTLLEMLPMIAGTLGATAVAAAVFYVLLPEGDRLLFAIALGGLTTATGMRARFAIGWWRGTSNPTGAERHFLDQYDLNVSDKSTRHAVVAETLVAVGAYVLGVLAFLLRGDPADTNRVLYGVAAVVGVLVLLWISVIAFERPRVLLPADFRRRATKRDTSAPPHAQRRPRPRRKPRAQSRKGRR